MFPRFLRCWSLFALAVAALSGPVVASSVAPAEARVSASFLLALGRLPSDSERASWAEKSKDAPIKDLIEQHRATLAADASARAQVALRAFHDAFGRQPGAQEENELKSATEAHLYVEQMLRHVERLRAQPKEYEEAISRAYRFVIQRDAYPEEITYWRERDTLSYVLLVGCIENWARRNQPGLMVTAGRPTLSPSSEFLVNVRLSPNAAHEARLAVGLAEPDEGPQEENPEAFGRNVIAAGATAVQTNARVHLVVAGGKRLGLVASGK